MRTMVFLHLDVRLLQFLLSTLATLGLSYIFYPAINLWINLNSFAVDNEELVPENKGEGSGEVTIGVSNESIK